MQIVETDCNRPLQEATPVPGARFEPAQSLLGKGEAQTSLSTPLRHGDTFAGNLVPEAQSCAREEGAKSV